MHVTGGGNVAREMGEMRRQSIAQGEVPITVIDFREHVAALANDRDPSHHKTVRALQLMADAVRVLPADPRREQSANAILEHTAELKSAEPSAIHSDATRAALEDAVHALDESSRNHHVDGLEARIGLAKQSVNRIDDQKPYLAQREVIDRAFIDVADAFVCATALDGAKSLGQETRTIKLERWGGDMKGQSPDVEGTCGGPAKLIVIDRTPGDLAAAVFTFGWYTPVHVRITCETHRLNTAAR
jgi:hypothetical protein